MRTRRFLIPLLSIALLLVLAGEPVRAAPQATISLTLNNPYCVRSQTAAGTCYINLRSASATASDTSFAHMDVSINGKVRMVLNGFFEASGYLSDRMLGNGLAVPCGKPNASGDPNFGYQYQVGFAGYLFTGSPAIDTAIVYCPYYDGKVFLPSVTK